MMENNEFEEITQKILLLFPSFSTSSSKLLLIAENSRNPSRNLGKRKHFDVRRKK